MTNNPFELKFLHRKMKPQKSLSFEEVYVDAKSEELEMLDDDREQINYRLLSGIILICMVVLFSRVFFLQVVKGAEYRSLAEGNKLRVQYLLAPRGLLLDTFGKTIVSNQPSFELVAVTADFPKDKVEFDGRITQIASVLEMDASVLNDSIKKLSPDSYSAQTLVQNITKDQALILMAKAADLKGFVVQNNPIRDYKDPMVFAHLTGYTGKITADELTARSGQRYLLNDYLGKTGIEYQYENYLRGIPGKRQMEVDAVGDLQKTLAEVPAIPGNNVVLNIDYDLQKVVYDSVMSMLEKTRTKKAAVIATNPKTGEVLALVSVPSFDSNMFARGIKTGEYAALLNDPSVPLLNRVVAGTYPPGSTIKPVMAIAGLSEGVVTPETKILDTGVIRVGSFTYYGYERAGLGLMDVYEAVARSSDIYFYTIGGGNLDTGFKGMGPDKIASWYRKFHMGSNLGIDLPSEKPGLVPDPAWKVATRNEQWFLGNTYHISIGQGDVLTTPLQVNHWTQTIANDGKAMRPYILKEVTDKDGQVLARGEQKVMSENFANPEYIKIAQDSMRQTVLIGSGRSLLNVGVDVAGKTGTSQFDPRDPYLTHAWWTSYAPFDDPQITFTVIVEAAGEGHAVAVPISRDVYTWWAQNRYNR